MFREALERKSREDHQGSAAGSDGADEPQSWSGTDGGRPVAAKDVHGRHASAYATLDMPVKLAADVPIPPWFPCADSAAITTGVTVTEGAGVHESLLRASRWDTLLAVATGTLHVTLFDAAVGGGSPHPLRCLACADRPP